MAIATSLDSPITSCAMLRHFKVTYAFIMELIAMIRVEYVSELLDITE